MACLPALRCSSQGACKGFVLQIALVKGRCEKCLKKAMEKCIQCRRLILKKAMEDTFVSTILCKKKLSVQVVDMSERFI
uniref:Uncharacterized protein n=1 Tax=Ascaris lumbricoides TaxID=6252 RepID=A0A0M3I1S1_ASCLU